MDLIDPSSSGSRQGLLNSGASGGGDSDRERENVCVIEREIWDRLSLRRVSDYRVG